jgi:hypothetical protein
MSEMQQPHGWKIGDRVRVAFADPTAAKCHKYVVGKIGTIEAIRDDLPMFLTNIHGQPYPCPDGLLTVRFDTPVEYSLSPTSKCTTRVEYLFPHELDAA